MVELCVILKKNKALRGPIIWIIPDGLLQGEHLLKC
jgi:hypothetical protein